MNRWVCGKMRRETCFIQKECNGGAASAVIWQRKHASMIAAAFGYLTPVRGALLQEVINVTVILNALRALRIAPQTSQVAGSPADATARHLPQPRSTAAWLERLLQMSRLSHSEVHMVHRIGWLRAAVLGANDGLVSTASLVVGVAAAGSGRPEIVIAGLAGLVAGAMSMAAGEYVSVSSQTDAEQADIARETRELKDAPEAELEELTRIYVGRGLDEGLARQVAIQLTEKDALGAHSRDELGISETVTAHPIQAALVSAATFAVGAVIPLIIAALVPAAQITLIVAATTLLALSVLGGLGASVGGAGIIKGAIRVTFWGALAMAATAAVGVLFGVTVG